MCGMAGMSRNRKSRARDIELAKQVKAFCENGRACRRAALLAHFEEAAPPSLCTGMCDVCAPPATPPAWAKPESSPGGGKGQQQRRRRPKKRPLDVVGGAAARSAPRPQKKKRTSAAVTRQAPPRVPLATNRPCVGETIDLCSQ